MQRKDDELMTDVIKHPRNTESFGINMTASSNEDMVMEYNASIVFHDGQYHQATMDLLFSNTAHGKNHTMK